MESFPSSLWRVLIASIRFVSKRMSFLFRFRRFVWRQCVNSTRNATSAISASADARAMLRWLPSSAGELLLPCHSGPLSQLTQRRGPPLPWPQPPQPRAQTEDAAPKTTTSPLRMPSTDTLGFYFRLCSACSVPCTGSSTSRSAQGRSTPTSSSSTERRGVQCLLSMVCKCIMVKVKGSQKMKRNKNGGYL